MGKDIIKLLIGVLTFLFLITIGFSLLMYYDKFSFLSVFMSVISFISSIIIITGIVNLKIEQINDENDNS